MTKSTREFIIDNHRIPELAELVYRLASEAGYIRDSNKPIRLNRFTHNKEITQFSNEDADANAYRCSIEWNADYYSAVTQLPEIIKKFELCNTLKLGDYEVAINTDGSLSVGYQISKNEIVTIIKAYLNKFPSASQ